MSAVGPPRLEMAVAASTVTAARAPSAALSASRRARPRKGRGSTTAPGGTRWRTSPPRRRRSGRARRAGCSRSPRRHVHGNDEFRRVEGYCPRQQHRSEGQSHGAVTLAAASASRPCGDENPDASAGGTLPTSAASAAAATPALRLRLALPDASIPTPRRRRQVASACPNGWRRVPPRCP